MPRSQRIYKKIKFHGNHYSREEIVADNKQEHNLSASSSKIDDNLKILDNSVSLNELSVSGFRFIDLQLLCDAINNSCACSNCKNTYCMRIAEKNRVGVACEFEFVCDSCGYKFSFISSKKCPEGIYESNFRLTYGMRCLGKGREGANFLCGMMNMPPPIARFDATNKCIAKVICDAAKESMKDAVDNIVKEREEKEEISEESTDLCVSVDGTWMKRGHTSLYGVSSVISIDSGKVLDVAIKSKYCHECAVRKPLQDPEAENEWAEKHKNICCKNYSGSSGGMESAAVVDMFCRSQSLYGVRYTKYLGDGDSASYKRVLDANPYDCKVEKLECIGHIQKRIGGRLRRLLKEKKGVLLSDGKTLGGRGRLSAKEIDSLQVYYGKAIRENNSSTEKMQKAIWAIYFHKLSTDDKPRHQLCPKEGWCKYNIDKDSYKHKNSLPEAVLDEIKPTFRVLSDPELLKKCLHGKTQNTNESFNNLVWLRCPKTTFCGIKILNIAVYDAVLCFNEGNNGRIKVLRKAGLEPGLHTIKILNDIDRRRIVKAESNLAKLQKEARQNIRAKRKDQEDEDEYTYGGH